MARGLFMKQKIRNFRERVVVLLIMLLSSVAAHSATLDSASFCVTDERFHFDVEMTGDGEELIFRIGAGSDPIGSAEERIAMNFDTSTGEFTRDPPLVPRVQTFDLPDFDRWADGEIADFELNSLGNFSWHFTGSVPHGADPFTPGDTIWGIVLRSFTSPNDRAQDLTVDGCEPDELAIDVPFSWSDPTIDGRLDFGEWSDAVRFDFEHGFFKFVHDKDRLYVLIDVLDDTGDDPFRLGGGDQFWLHFDIDEDGAITPDVDLRFRLESGTGNLRYQTYCDDCLFGFNSLESSTLSARGEGFDCFFEDGSATILPNLSCSPHRIWELALDLGETGLRSDRSTRFGYLVGSGSPLFNATFPADLNDHAAYGRLNLEVDARQRHTSGPGSMDPRFEVTQAIQTPANDVDLAAGKATAIRIWDETNNSLVKVFVYGARDSIDLPGSPLLDFTSLSSSFVDAPRDSITRNSTNALPPSWVRGHVDFEVRIRGLDDSEAAGLQANIAFAPTRTPIFWTVPIRIELPDVETLFTASASQIATAEQWLQRIVPIEDVTFVRRPILDVFNPTSASLKQTLNEYDQTTILAWTLGLLATGQPPFALPEQTTGFTPFGISGLAGSSDRIGRGGRGRVTWVRDTTNPFNMTYAHELNHNVDQKATSTWGLHSGGCNAQSGGPLDPQWPYATFRIQEVGVAPVVANGMFPFQSLSDMVWDFMSYCRASSSPSRWWSPYRWQAWVDEFRTDLAARGTEPQSSNSGQEAWRGAVEQIEDSFYIQGRVYLEGDGELGNVIRQPGIPESPPVAGDYAVRVLDCSGGELASGSFDIQFLGDEGEIDPFVGFSLTLPASGASCQLQLARLGEVLDTRVISSNAPEVTVVAPNGDEIWEGTHTAVWSATDADEDPLQFTLLYSADGGMTWLPVATGITGNQLEIDTRGLPASTDARLRVLASDGANTTTDDSDNAFTVVPKPPRVEIISPADNGMFDFNEPLALQGVARDTFGQPLPVENLIWRVDGIAVGTGASIVVNLDDGVHDIELQATGGDLVSTRTVTISMADLRGVIFANGFEAL